MAHHTKPRRTLFQDLVGRSPVSTVEPSAQRDGDLLRHLVLPITADQGLSKPVMSW